MSYPPLREHAEHRAHRASKQDILDALFFELPPVVADRCITLYLEASSFAEANGWSSEILTYATDFTADQQRRILAGVGENYQLYNSNTIGSVITRLRQSKKLPAAEFEQLLTENGLQRLVPDHSEAQ